MYVCPWGYVWPLSVITSCRLLSILQTPDTTTTLLWLWPGWRIAVSAIIILAIIQFQLLPFCSLINVGLDSHLERKDDCMLLVHHCTYKNALLPSNSNELGQWYLCLPPSPTPLQFIHFSHAYIYILASLLYTFDLDRIFQVMMWREAPPHITSFSIARLLIWRPQWDMQSVWPVKTCFLKELYSLITLWFPEDAYLISASRIFYNSNILN